MTVFTMNFFIAILNDSFIEAREIREAEPTDAQLSDFIEEYTKEMLKEISKEIQGFVGRKDENGAVDSPTGDSARNKETWERDYFLY